MLAQTIIPLPAVPNFQTNLRRQIFRGTWTCISKVC
uniref:Uncharacterized protein n=1 Tax=Anguilla anguilla TaxID=7936 RepID=A0A0E9QWV3_ANGAN